MLDLFQNLVHQVNKKLIYSELINLLGLIETIVTNETQFKFIRKNILDIANEVMRSDIKDE